MFNTHPFLSEKNVAVTKIRAKTLNAARSWFNKNGYTEVHAPSIIPAAGDWPNHFEVKYFDKKAYLATGLQPFANAFAASFGKVYTIAPAFRAEKMKTKRHLPEYWRIETAQQCELDNMVRVQEELMTHICQTLSEKSKETLKYFNRSFKDLATVQTPFTQLTYDEAIDMLQKDGFKISWGHKINWKLENHLSLKFDKPFFIVKFPLDTETYFLKSDPEKPELTLSVDMLAPEGYGELSSGAQMITEKEDISQRMDEAKIDPADQTWCMSLMQCPSAPQSGFAIGLERLIQWICKLGDIKETTGFPSI